MFGSKDAPQKAAHIAEQDSRDGAYQQEFEYRTLAILGAVQFDKEVNDHARRGWELVNGCMAGTIHYAYLRRRLGER